MTLLLTVLTLISFAANSLLCRMALQGQLIDPVSFTAIRLVSGALALNLISRLVEESKGPQEKSGSWMSSFALFAYAIAFSLAYVSLSAGMGALILFGAVQVTMIGVSLYAGEKLRLVQWIGFVLAMSGLFYLVAPGLAAPDPLGALLMFVAGISWGVYSLRGKGVSTPVAMTAANFAAATPWAILASLLALSSAKWQLQGVLLAIISGVLTSGLGYVLWYRALRGLTRTQASIVQLLVPVLAGFGGILFLAEQLSFRLIAASTFILGGVALAITKIQRKPATTSIKEI